MMEVQIMQRGFGEAMGFALHTLRFLNIDIEQTMNQVRIGCDLPALEAHVIQMALYQEVMEDIERERGLQSLFDLAGMCYVRMVDTKVGNPKIEVPYRERKIEVIAPYLYKVIKERFTLK